MTYQVRPTESPILPGHLTIYIPETADEPETVIAVVPPNRDGTPNYSAAMLLASSPDLLARLEELRTK